MALQQTTQARGRPARGGAGSSAARRRPTVLAIGYNIYGTGLTRVMRTVMGRLSDRFKVDFLGLGYKEPESVVDGVRMLPTNMQGGGDVFAAFQALEMARAAPPDVLFVLHDIWMFEYYGRMFAPLRPATRLIAYIPLDGRIVDPEIALPLKDFDCAIVYTEWAAQELRSAFAALLEKGVADSFPPVEVIYHGVETATFGPDPALLASGFDRRARADLKRQVFPDIEDPAESFVVLNAARPAVRKRVDITIEGFARFAAGKPGNVRLCLHHAITEPETADLLALVDRLGIAERLVYNPLSPQGGALSEDDLARIYRACDVGVNTAMGEGWGLVGFEHASTGAAQVIPNHTACGALWNSATAQIVEPVAWKVTEFSPLEMGEVDAAGVAAALEALYSDPAALRRISKAGHDYATDPAFSWDEIARQFAESFDRQIALASAG